MYLRDPAARDDDLGNWSEYGLCFDYLTKGTFRNHRRGYFRYQLSWGGPSDEFRFYVDENHEIDQVEYWFLEWFDGAKVSGTRKNFEVWLEIWEDFKEMGLFEAKMREAA